MNAVAPPRPAHWYHIWAGDTYHGSNWRMPASEHFGTLWNAEFAGDVYIGLVGGENARREARIWLRGWWPEHVLAAEADEGFEQVTIAAMQQWCAASRPDTPVLYSHTKGAFQDHPANHAWRRSMDGALIEDWQERVRQLREYDAIGSHWLTHEEFPQWIDAGRPMFGGNFWWATAGYIATLPPVEFRSRWHAEGWLGQASPKVLDLKPGWPSYAG